MSLFTTAKNLHDLETMWSAFTTNEVMALTDIYTGLQMRADGTDKATVDDYVAKLEAGVTFPPLDVFVTELYEIGEQIVLADGYHRYHAMKKAGIETVDVRCFRGRTIEEVEMYASFANVKNGKSASNEDITRAIGRLLCLDGAQEKFVVNAKLDVKAIAAWVGVHVETARDLTKDIRKFVTWIRDQQIEILKEEGMTVREIAAEVGCSKNTVARHESVPKQAGLEMGQTEDSQRPTTSLHPKSLFNTGDEEDNTWMLDDDDMEALEDEARPIEERRQAVEQANKKGWESLTKQMADEGKVSKKKKEKPSRTERAANAISLAVIALSTLEEVNPDLKELADYTEKMPGLANDIVILSAFMETLRERLETEEIA